MPTRGESTLTLLLPVRAALRATLAWTVRTTGLRARWAGWVAHRSLAARLAERRQSTGARVARNLRRQDQVAWQVGPWAKAATRQARLEEVPTTADEAMEEVLAEVEVSVERASRQVRAVRT